MTSSSFKQDRAFRLLKPDLFEPLIKEIYSHITSSVLVSSKLFVSAVTCVFPDQLISKPDLPRQSGSVTPVMTSSSQALDHVTNSEKCKGSQAFYFVGIFSLISYFNFNSHYAAMYIFCFISKRSDFERIISKYSRTSNFVPRAVSLAWGRGGKRPWERGCRTSGCDPPLVSDNLRYAISFQKY